MKKKNGKRKKEGGRGKGKREWEGKMGEGRKRARVTGKVKKGRDKGQE